MRMHALALKEAAASCQRCARCTLQNTPLPPACSYPPLAVPCLLCSHMRCRLSPARRPVGRVPAVQLQHHQRDVGRAHQPRPAAAPDQLHIRCQGACCDGMCMHRARMQCAHAGLRKQQAAAETQAARCPVQVLARPRNAPFSHACTSRALTTAPRCAMPRPRAPPPPSSMVRCATGAAAACMHAPVRGALAGQHATTRVRPACHADDVFEALLIMSKPAGHPDPCIPAVFVSEKAGLIMSKLLTPGQTRVRIVPVRLRCAAAACCACLRACMRSRRLAVHACVRACAPAHTLRCLLHPACVVHACLHTTAGVF